MFELRFYGVGAGEADSEGDASVAGAFFLTVAFFLCGDGDGDALVVAAVVEVAVVPCCCVQEAINAMPIKAVIKDKTDFFIRIIVKVKELQNMEPQERTQAINCHLPTPALRLPNLLPFY